MPLVVVAVPAGDQVRTEFAYDLTRMVSWTMLHSDLDVAVLFNQGSLTTLQRESIVKDVLETPATHMLWLDSDMRVPKETLLGLMQHGKPFVAANYSTRRMPPRPVAFYDEAGKEHCYTDDTKTGLESVHAVGLGCALVEVAALKRLAQPYFLTPWSTSSASHVGEDVYFCRKLREAGVDILVDHDLSKFVDHVGSFTYRHAHTLIKDEDAHQ